jgi:hypothetical protein
VRCTLETETPSLWTRRDGKKKYDIKEEIENWLRVFFTRLKVTRSISDGALNFSMDFSLFFLFPPLTLFP